MSTRRGYGTLVDLARYAGAMAGNAGSSGAQFLLSLVLIAQLPAASFGIFAFLQLLFQFVVAVAGALFAAPMATIAREMTGHEMAGREGDVAPSATDAPDVWTVLNVLQVAYGLLAGVLAIGVGIGLGTGGPVAIVYGLVILMGCLRQFGRIAQYSRAGQPLVIVSDGLYAITLVAGVAALFLRLAPDTILLAFVCLALAHTVAILPLAAQFLELHHFIAGSAPGRRGPFALLGTYRQVWSRYSGWSLMGVVSTEAVANVHGYLVTLFLGPASYAAIGASGVLTRPGNVAMLALGEFERARFAGLHAGRRDLKAARRLFAGATLLIWLATFALTLAVQWRFPEILIARGYHHDEFMLAAWGWLAVMLAWAIYVPASTEMQALGAFRQLAWPTVVAVPVSVVGTIVLLHFCAPGWTLAAITLGQMVAGGLILVQRNRLVRAQETAA